MSRHRLPALRRALLLPLAASLALSAAACGGDDDAPAARNDQTVAPALTEPTDRPTTSEEPTAAPTATEPDAEASTTTEAATTPGDVDLSGVTLRVGDNNNLKRPLLEASGELETLPFSIDWSDFPGAPGLFEAVNADAIDIGHIGDSPIINAAAAGIPVTAVLASAGSTDDDHLAALIVRNESDVTSVAELAGRKVAFPRGTNQHYFVARALADVGLSLDDIDAVDLPPADAVAAFLNGDIDAFSTAGVGLANLVLNENPRILVTGATIASDGQPLARGYQFVVVHNDVLDDPVLAAAAGEYVAALARAQEWGAAQLDEWTQLWADLSGLDPEVTALTESFFFPKAIAIDDALVEDLQHRADLFADFGVLPSTPDLSPYFDARFNDLILSAAG